MRDKLGLFGQDPKDLVLILDLLTWMHKNKADYTNTFCFLMNEKVKDEKIYNSESFIFWKKRWQDRLKQNKSSEKYLELMKSVNPMIIPRNHMVEEVLEAAINNDIKPIKSLVEALSTPYEKNGKVQKYKEPPSFSKIKYKTFCGT
jgi:uncharacterized protein YdiU (UPF0061 family)